MPFPLILAFSPSGGEGIALESLGVFGKIDPFACCDGGPLTAVVMGREITNRLHVVIRGGPAACVKGCAQCRRNGHIKTKCRNRCRVASPY